MTNKARDLPGDASPILHLRPDDGFALRSGQRLAELRIAYDVAGALAPARDNVIIVFHALTGDQFVARPNPINGRAPWWPTIVGPGKPIDTDRFFVVCANVLGGCMGSTGPASPGPDGAPWGARLPLLTIADMARAQALLLDHLGVDAVRLAIGGSLGGMLALSFATLFPERTRACAAIAACAAHPPHMIGLYEIGRTAIRSDPDWRKGDYARFGVRPGAGLGLARMLAQISYRTDAEFAARFGRQLQSGAPLTYVWQDQFQIESYLRHHAQKFNDRFDANSYLYLTRAMDYFDLAADHGGDLRAAFAGSPVRFGIFSFDSDWHYPPALSRDLANAIAAVGAPVDLVETASLYGHDSFLLDVPAFIAAIAAFVE